MWWFFDFLRVIVQGDDLVAEVERQKAGADDTISISSEDSDSEEKTSTVKQTVVNPSLAATEGTAMATNDNAWFLSGLRNCCSCLATCCIWTYVLCPPFPSCIVRKAAFRPPKRGRSYKLRVKTGNDQVKYVSSASQALKYSEVKIVPLLLEKYPDDVTIQRIIAREMVPVDGFIIRSKSGNPLVCGFFKSKYSLSTTSKNSRKKVVLFSQPNSSDLGGFMQPFLHGASLPSLAHVIGTDIYAFDYSGYGRSNGSPSETNIYQDIESVFEEIIKREGNNVQVMLMGFSIGTTAAVDLASKKSKNLMGLILMAPFTSGIRLITNNPRKEETSCLDCFTSYDKIPLVDVPVLIIHGTADEVIPLSHGQVLYERAKNKVDPLIVDGGSHVSIINGTHWIVHRAIRNFIIECYTLQRSPSIFSIEGSNTTE